MEEQPEMATSLEAGCKVKAELTEEMGWGRLREDSVMEGPMENSRGFSSQTLPH